MPVTIRRPEREQNRSTGWEGLIGRAADNERAKIDKHLEVLDAEIAPGHARLWRRLAAELGGGTPVGVHTVGKRAWRFFIPDGRYRVQVFALEDPFDGTLVVYLPDVLADAIAADILTPTADPIRFGIAGSAHPLQVEPLRSADFSEPPEHFKAMLGWNRTALRLALRTADPDGPATAAACSLFALAARRWADAPGDRKAPTAPAQQPRSNRAR